MNDDSCRPRRGWQVRAAPLAVTVAVTTLLAAACGGGSHAATATASPGQPTAQKLDSFAACMRGHGMANFYFSSASGTSTSALMAKYPGGFVKLGQWVAPADPGSPQFQAARKACRHLLPGGGPQPVSQQQIDRLVKAAACMRAHGYPDYPDPTVRSGAIARPPLPASINTASPQFESALAKCNGG